MPPHFIPLLFSILILVLFLSFLALFLIFLPRRRLKMLKEILDMDFREEETVKRFLKLVPYFWFLLHGGRRWSKRMDVFRIWAKRKWGRELKRVVGEKREEVRRGLEEFARKVLEEGFRDRRELYLASLISEADELFELGLDEELKGKIEKKLGLKGTLRKALFKVRLFYFGV